MELAADSGSYWIVGQSTLDHLIIVNLACMPNFSFLSGSNILVRGGVGGFTVIIMQVSVQIGLNLTGLELSLAKKGTEERTDTLSDNVTP